MLYTVNSTRQDTQLAYRVRCFPWDVLSPAAKQLIVWRQGFYLRKMQLEALILQPQQDDPCQVPEFLHSEKHGIFRIEWAYGSIPTQEEWDGKGDRFHIHVDLRISPACANSRIALLDFKLPSSYLRAPADDDML
jgi:hypothetical protein